MTEPHAHDPPDASRPWRILKFGGTSVTGPDRLDVIAAVLRDRCEGSRPVVVVSAQAGITNVLSTAAMEAATGAVSDEAVEAVRARHADAVREAGLAGAAAERVLVPIAELEHLLRGVALVKECSPRTLDRILSIGELASAALVAEALTVRGLCAKAMDAAGFVVTDSSWGRARVDFHATEVRVLEALAGSDPALPIVTGFLGATSRGERTTLGRGGSDYSAAVLGWALRAEAVEIWTDVDGVMSADPRLVEGARPLRSLSYAELLELSHWGARVVHPKTVPPLRERAVPVIIKNTLSPDDPGTTVLPESVAFPAGPVRGVASIDGVALLQLDGQGREGTSLTARLLAALDGAGIHVLIVTQGSSEHSVCVAFPHAAVEQALDAVSLEFDLERRAGVIEPPAVEGPCAIVAVVGQGLKDDPGVIGELFGVLGRSGVNVRAIAQGSSDLNISCVVRAEHAAVAVRSIHEAFFRAGGADEESPPPALTASLRNITDDVVDLTRRLIAIPSVTGSERRITRFVADLLESQGWSVVRQPVSAGRENLWARRGPGRVTMSTHLDTVPGDFGHRLIDGRVYGRGACDAKGIAAAMLCAAARLVDGGEERFDLLFVVGEEGGSDGARAANGLDPTSRYLVNGEPTEGVLASGAKGTLRVTLRTAGVEAHSAYPERGRSAIGLMTLMLAELPAVELPSDPELGPTTVNVGTVSGGTAANVVAGACESELMIRLVGDPGPVQEAVVAWVRGRAEIEWGSHVPVQRFHVLDGFDVAPVGYTSDAPLLRRWGTPLLYGPGSIHVAHTPEEHVAVDDLNEAVDDYVRIVRALLAGDPGVAPGNDGRAT